MTQEVKMISIAMGDSTGRVPAGTSAGEAVSRLGGGAPDDLVAVRDNGRLLDLSHTITADARLTPVTARSKEGLEILRHSAAHVMAEAVRELFPGVKVTIGPAIENGFYYDFDYERPFVPDDLPAIEARMKDIVARALPFRRSELSRKEAVDLFRKLGEPYKVEMLEEMEAETVSIYEQGSFVDLCRGPHVPDTGAIRAFKLTGVAGSYWRGDEKRQQLQRIYGTAFFDAESLELYLYRLEEAQRRDHRKLGKELDLFSFHEEAGAGLVVFHPKGALLRTLLMDFERKEHFRRGYQEVVGPQLLKLDLWKQSGHYENYRENMYFTEIENVAYGIKPMNCLAHMLIYQSRVRSFRDLPIRYFELGTVHRHERSGVLHGLTRVRQFTQDDAHILCTPEQLNGEIKGVLEFVADVMKLFDFPFELELSTRPEKSIGSDESWERATAALSQALNDLGLPYEVNEGDGAFYGPKIDVKIRDALDRSWQCATIQGDFTLPERFDLTYVGSDNERHRPIMIHRVILGSLERFMGVLIEHYGGAFPVWLSPVQAVLLSVTDRNIPFVEETCRRMIRAGLRVEKDVRNEKLGFKIREAQLQKIPYMLVVGDRESESGTLAPRMRDGKNLKNMPVDDFIAMLLKESEPLLPHRDAEGR